MKKYELTNELIYNIILLFVLIARSCAYEAAGGRMTKRIRGKYVDKKSYFRNNRVFRRYRFNADDVYGVFSFGNKN